MQHLSYKSSSFAKTSVPIHSEMSASGLKEVTLSFSRAVFDVSSGSHEVSCDGKADSKL